LQSRLTDARFQLTTDGFHFYERGVEDVFGGTVDFAQLVKLFGDYGQHGDERYSPPRITEVISKVRDGRPDPAHISTSHIERQNLTMRMQMRRFTRLTNAFSKKLQNLQAAVTLYFAWYNFCCASLLPRRLGLPIMSGLSVNCSCGPGIRYKGIRGTGSPVRV
jgi:hypothetical protein